MKRSVLIIGGGIAGASLAATLDLQKYDVQILDKGRGRGGRVATRRVQSNGYNFHFDHGAQYIEYREKQAEFHPILDRWREQGLVKEWSARIGEIRGGLFTHTFEDTPVFVGYPTMNQLVKSILPDISFHPNTRVASIRKEGDRYMVISEDETHYWADHIILTTPPTQAKEILNSVDLPELTSKLDQVHSSPRWALLLGFSTSLSVDFEAAFTPESSKIAYIANNSSKPERPQNEAWIIHSTREWTEAALEFEPAVIKSELLDEFQYIISQLSPDPLPGIIYQQVHRWRYAIISQSLPDRFVISNDNKIALAADYCGGNNIQSAYLSGLALGNHLNSF